MRYVIIWALAAAALASWYGYTSTRGAGDLSWALCAARQIAGGHNPYDAACRPAGSIDGQQLPTNPLPTALVVAPLAWLPGYVAAGLFIFVSVAALVWGVSRAGEHWRALMLLSWPAIACTMLVNWPILLIASVYMPKLASVLIVKPQLAPALWFARPGRHAVIGAIGLLGISLLVRPDWLAGWLGTLGGYSGAVALFTMPPMMGVIVVAAIALCWGDRRARYLLICSLIPLRPAYDWLILMIIASSWRQLAVMIFISWAAFFAGEMGHEWYGLCLSWAAAAMLLTPSVCANQKEPQLTAHPQSTPFRLRFPR